MFVVLVAIAPPVDALCFRGSLKHGPTKVQLSSPPPACRLCGTWNALNYFVQTSLYISSIAATPQDMHREVMVTVALFVPS
jgi:hypothetical protein